MGLIFDSSIFIANERGRFDMAGFLQQFALQQPVIAAITASELLHGVERAPDSLRRSHREQHVEQILASVLVQPFELAQARHHARIWAVLEARGTMIGAHDLQIAATGLSLSYEVATLNVREFARVPGLGVIDATRFNR
ncbi:MAG TPA: PIN domain-containing protein [Verrucomicrobiae bacterium]|jgi:predicted nucleic acid-binding protein|nr:PIN domain-containing protein [Verrucomicrobiae bacterium]